MVTVATQKAVEILVKSTNKSLKRFNSSIAAVVVKNGVGYIKHQDINPIDELLFEFEGVHKFQAGNEIFFNITCLTIEQFKTKGICVYPQTFISLQIKRCQYY